MGGKKLFEFSKFPPQPTEINSFRLNVGTFLERYGNPQKSMVKNMRCWLILLWTESGYGVPLFVLEWNMECFEDDEQIGCHECSINGWSHHLLTKRRYDFVIPAEEDWHKTCLEGGDLSKNTHLLHGSIHSNGYGHLLGIKGAESGSKVLFGREIMNLWDRICTNMAARKITVNDISKKRSMDIRLLYGVAYGCSWFGKWDYRFFHGSFGVTEEIYQKALIDLRSLTLDQVVNDLGNNQSGSRLIKTMIQHYRDVSNTQLITIKDLLHLMLSKKTNIIKSSSPTSLPAFGAITKVTKGKSEAKKAGSNWTPTKLEDTMNVLANILRRTNKVMSRSELKTEANKYIGDTGLINRAISMIQDHVYDGYVVERTKRVERRGYEYKIDPIAGDGGMVELTEKPGCKTFGMDVYSDVSRFYKLVFQDYPVPSLKEKFQVLLDTKYFVKEYSSGTDDNKNRTYFCVWSPEPKGVDPPVEEVVVLPRDATYDDLLRAAQGAIRDSFYGMDKFVVKGVSHIEELKNLSFFDNKVEVSNLVGSDSRIFILGDGIDAQHKLKYEGGYDSNNVNCTCGASVADGEDMWSCHGCGVKQHIRCSGLVEAAKGQGMLYCPKCSWAVRK